MKMISPSKSGLISSTLLVASLALFQDYVAAFTIQSTSGTSHVMNASKSRTRSRPLTTIVTNAAMDDNDKSEGEMNGNIKAEYKNVATSILSNFMQNGDDSNKSDTNSDQIESSSSEGSNNKYAENPILSKIDFDAPKATNIPIGTLASILDYELYNKEWFVTGNVNPIYFDESFEFQDPDVQLKGIEEYAVGVNKLFDQKTSRAEIISTVVNPNDANMITVTWRLSGKVNIGPKGLSIKPYICYTDFKVDTEGSGLITFQEDRFDIPQWDILLSALFPFLIGKVTSDPAPPVPERDVVPVMPNLKQGSSGSAKSGLFDLESVFGPLFKN